MIAALSAFGWMGYARVVRAEVLRIKELDFINAARTDGAGDLRLIAEHILPNALFPLMIMATMAIGSMVLTASALSFLGVGLAEGYADWGNFRQLFAQLDHRAELALRVLVHAVLPRNGDLPVRGSAGTCSATRCATSSTPASPNRTNRNEPVVAGRHRALRRADPQRGRGQAASSLSYVIVDRDGIRAKGHVRRSDLDHRMDDATEFRIGSITKTFTAICMMQLVEAGLVDLDADVATYIPHFKPINPFRRCRRPDRSAPP